MALTKVSAGVLNIDDLYGFRNRLINGDMQIDQRNNGSSLTPTSSETYTIDRFLLEMGASTGHNGTIQRISDAPTGSGHTFSVRYTAGSTATWNSSTGWGAFSQRIEGFNVADFGWGTASAKPVTLSFWVKASVAGLYTVNMTHYDGSTERWNNITYTINNANTWEQKTLTFVGDASFGIANDNGTNGWIRLYWHLGDNAGGAATSTTFNSWFNGTSTRRAAVGSTNVMNTSGRTWQITGVQLETGSVATPFERRPYGLELALCQRYYEVIPCGNESLLGAYTTGNGSRFNISAIPFAVEKRAAPAMPVVSPTGQWVVSGVVAVSASTTTAFTPFNMNTRTFTVSVVRNTGGSTPNNGSIYMWEQSVTFTASAEF